jgi:hypothetical protein
LRLLNRRSPTESPAARDRKGRPAVGGLNHGCSTRPQEDGGGVAVLRLWKIYRMSFRFRARGRSYPQGRLPASFACTHPFRWDGCLCFRRAPFSPRVRPGRWRGSSIRRAVADHRATAVYRC